jgi:chloramphenicol-sensitive protein RarD
LSDSSTFRSGLIYGLIAYVCWGIVPLYFRQLAGVDTLEILAHRITWSLPLMLLVMVFTPGGFHTLWTTLTNRRLVLSLMASSMFLSINWLLYIYATSEHRVAEASLGYFMLPLVNAVLASVFLGEKLRPAHYPALAIILLGVLIPMVMSGQFLWLSVALPITFGIYGLIRKKLPVDSSTGLTIETLVLAVPCWIYLFWQASRGEGKFGTDGWLTFWFVFGGVMTVVPLLTFTLSVRRLPLLTQSFIQFVSPLVQILVTVFLLKEVVTTDRWIALGCVLVAVCIFIGDAVVRYRAAKVERELVL